MLDMLRGRASEIRLEPPGEEGEGVEFWLRTTDSKLEFHQVKRQRTGQGQWTISSIKRVLESFLAKLDNPDAECVFVSGHAAADLDELSDRAQKSLNFTEFKADWLAKEWGAKFEELHKTWGAASREQSFDALRRVRVEVIGEPRLKDMNELESEVAVVGNLAVLPAVLTDILRDSAGEFLTEHTIWKRLEEFRFTPNAGNFTLGLAAQTGDQNERFKASRRSTLINGGLLERPESTEILSASEGNQIVLVDGDAGMGKSDVLLQFVEDLDREALPYLAIRLDQVDATTNPLALGEELGLSKSPQAVLTSIAPDGPGFLVLDQVDIVSTSSGRNPKLFDCVDQIVRAVLTRPNLCVVLACRSFDIKNDVRLRRLTVDDERSTTVTIGPLHKALVMDVLEVLGLGESEVKDRQLELLSTPLNLALLAETIEPGERA
ncbi:MAG: hypothetical protein IPK93_02445 [Solirubrobacterales bacterium]|nr:hypothetical protein [Solirubrobacterales bacterium]